MYVVNGKFYHLMLRLNFGTWLTVCLLFVFFSIACLVLSVDNKDEVATTAFDLITIENKLNISFILANGIKNAFVLVQISRYQQVTGVFTFQCPSELIKVSHFLTLFIFK